MAGHLEGVHPVLSTMDVAASVQFYFGLGFGVVFQDRREDPTYVAVERDGVQLHIQWADPQQWAYPTDRPAYRFVVSDPDMIYAEFLDNGSIAVGTREDSPWSVPGDTPWGTREFHVRDPGGNSLQFFRPLVSDTVR
jgi:catechol 2,3-dioxygenase-like lactoylglutathione lyase family enzyme